MSLYDRISEEKKKEIGDYIHRKWEEASKSSLRSQILEDMKDARDAYDQNPTSEELWDNAINLVLPFLSISVDQLEPRLVASLVAHEDVIKINDRGELDEDLAKDIETIDNVILNDDVKIREIIKDHIHDILLDGHVFLAPYWEFKEGKVREFVTDDSGAPVLSNGEVPDGMIEYAGKLMREKVVKVSDKVKVDKLDPESVFFPDRIDDWEEAPVIYEHYISLAEYRGKLRRGVKGWVGYEGDDMVELEGKLYEKRPNTSILKEGEEEDKGIRALEGEKLKAEFRCLQGHITYDVDDDGIEEKVVCIIEESTHRILYLMDNAELDPLNRKQIRVIRLMPRSGTGYGYSLYSKLKMIQEGGSDATNIMLNSSIIQMLPFFFYEEAAGFSNKEIELFPGAGIQVGDVKRIMMNQFQPNAGAFKDVIEIFFKLWQYIITLPDYSLGKEPASDGSTATGVLALLQEASVAHDYMGSRLHDQYGELFRIIHDLCYLNMSPSREVELLGHVVERKVLSNSYKIRLVSTTKSANRHVERMEMQEALSIAKEGVAQGVVVPDEPIRDYLELFSGINVEKWMSGPISKVAGRMRESLGLNGKKKKEVDPFGEFVLQLLTMPPDAIIQLIQTMHLGKLVKDDMTEAVSGSALEGVGGNVGGTPAARPPTSSATPTSGKEGTGMPPTGGMA